MIERKDRPALIVLGVGVAGAVTFATIGFFVWKGFKDRQSQYQDQATVSQTVETTSGPETRTVGSRVQTALGMGTVVCLSNGVAVTRLDSGAWDYSVEGLSGLASTGARTSDDLASLLCLWKGQGKITNAQKEHFLSCIGVEGYPC